MVSWCCIVQSGISFGMRNIPNLGTSPNDAKYLKLASSAFVGGCLRDTTLSKHFYFVTSVHQGQFASF